MKNFINFLNNSPTSFQAVDSIRETLLMAGYEALDERNSFKIEKGKKYFVERNGSSIIAFNIGKKLSDPALMMSASHSDCPSFKVKPEAFIVGKDYVQLNTEVYGSPLYYPWLDRPLSLAGRILVKDGEGIKTVSFVDDKPFCIIPSLAIHMNREANKSLSLNPQIDLLPLCSLEKRDFKEYLSNKLKVKKDDVRNFDLYLYPVMPAYVWGMDNEFVSSYHIDDLACAYAGLEAFKDTFNDENINVYCCFDNEEVGSLTRQGANSNFLETTLRRICDCLKIDYYALLANGMMLSCDNGHALHPNHPEKSDPVNRPYLNKGVVIKYNANQSYTTDGLSCAIFKDLLDKKSIPNQYFTNRSDERGGGTLGNISNGHVSIMSVDIGMPQLAMHSPLETAGVKDVEYIKDAIKAFYKAHLILNKGYNTLED